MLRDKIVIQLFFMEYKTSSAQIFVHHSACHFQADFQLEGEKATHKPLFPPKVCHRFRETTAKARDSWFQAVKYIWLLYQNIVSYDISVREASSKWLIPGQPDQINLMFDSKKLHFL